MSMILSFARTGAAGITCCGTARDSASLTQCAMPYGWRVTDADSSLWKQLKTFERGRNEQRNAAEPRG